MDWDDVVFEVDLLKSQEINLDYILKLVFEHSRGTADKAPLVEEVRRTLRASSRQPLERGTDGGLHQPHGFAFVQ